MTETDMATIRVAPEKNILVIGLTIEARGLVEYAKERVISTDADLSPATDDLSMIAKFKKALTETKMEYVRPIQWHLNTVSAVFAEVLGLVEEADAITRDKILSYRGQQLRRQAEADAINRQKLELAQREAQFTGTGETTIDLTPIGAPPPVQHVRTEMGMAGIVKTPTSTRCWTPGKLPNWLRAAALSLASKWW